MRRTTLAASLSAALLLTACGGPGSDPGATINGTDYTVAEIQEAAAQLSGGVQAASTPQDVIRDLAVLPVVENILDGSPMEATEAQIREVLSASGVSDPGRATLEAGKARMYLQQLNNPATFQAPGMEEAIAKLQAVTDADFEAVDIEVNPRFGSWDPAAGVVPSVPAWISSDAQR